MGDSYGEAQKGRSFNTSREPGRTGFRGNRGPNNREMGGFRIRLSDNEISSVRKIQETFNLRSTVSVLGFSVRTLGQMLEEGKLDEFINEYRSNSIERGPNPSRNYRGERRGDTSQGTSDFKNKPNPFARPSKPLNENAINDVTNKNESDIEELKENFSEVNQDNNNNEEISNDN